MSKPRVHGSRRHVRRRLRVVVGGTAALASLGLLFGGPLSAPGAGAVESTNQYLSTAQQGVALASSINTWGNNKFHWFNEVLNDKARSPQATLWGIVPMFETVDFDALANPSAANIRLVRHFAGKAATYWDKNITPAPGVKRKTPAYAPYPHSYNNPKTFFDDNAWFSLAFLDAYQVMVKIKNSRLAAVYLADAERGFNFINQNGWDNQDGGGMWWNTKHQIPGGQGRSGEALGAATALAARLFQVTLQPEYLEAAQKFVIWANTHILKWDGSYANSIPREVTMPHDGEGMMIAAFTALCESPRAGPVPSAAYSTLPPNKTQGVMPSFRLPYDPQSKRALDPSSWCNWAESVANSTANGVNPGGGIQDAYFPLSEGPMWDTIYVRGLVALYAHDHNSTWYRLIEGTVQKIIKNARGAGGLFTKDWDGSSNVPASVPGDIRTDGASLSAIAALGAAGSL
jgi:hypothetical protein